MAERVQNVIEFPAPHRRSEIKYRALPEEDLPLQVIDIDETIRGLYQIRRAIIAAYKKRKRAASAMLLIWFWQHSHIAIVVHVMAIAVARTQWGA